MNTENMKTKEKLKTNCDTVVLSSVHDPIPSFRKN